MILDPSLTLAIADERAVAGQIGSVFGKILFAIAIVAIVRWAFRKIRKGKRNDVQS